MVRDTSFKTYPLLADKDVPQDFPNRDLLLRFRTAPLALFFRRMFDTCSVEPRGLLHLGAHEGDDLLSFLMLGFKRIITVDPHPKAFALLQKTVDFLNKEVLSRIDGLVDTPRSRQELLACNVAVGATAGTATLGLNAAHPEMSSLLELQPGQVVLQHDQIAEFVTVPVTTVDALIATTPWARSDFNVFYANIEGSELAALRGATETLVHVEFIYLEANLVAHHVGDPTVDELDQFLDAAGFERKWSFSMPWPPDHGFLVYVKKP